MVRPSSSSLKQLRGNTARVLKKGLEVVSTSIKCQDFSLLLFRIRISYFGKGIPVSYFEKEISLSNHLFFLHHVFSELPPIHLLAQCSSISARKKQQKAKKTQSGILSIPILDSFEVLRLNNDYDLMMIITTMKANPTRG